MSLRREILNEIKVMLNEADDPEVVLKRLIGYIGKLTVDQIPHALAPETAREFLEAARQVVAVRTDAASPTGIVGGYKSGRDGPLKLRTICKLGNVGGKYNFLTTKKGEKVQWCNEEADVSPAPKPPKPEVDPCETKLCARGEKKVRVGNECKCVGEDIELRASGCRPNSKYIGKNGITQGKEVEVLQAVLVDAGLTGGKSLSKGIFDARTEQAVVKFQQEYGSKYAQKIKSELGREFPLDKTDGCTGPKTACALLLYVSASDNLKIAGYNKSRCKAAFGKKYAKEKRVGQTDLPPEDMSGGESIAAESKNWLDRTREGASTSLFERLVKDVSKKKVI